MFSQEGERATCLEAQPESKLEASPYLLASSSHSFSSSSSFSSLLDNRTIILPRLAAVGVNPREPLKRPAQVLLHRYDGKLSGGNNRLTAP